MRVASRTGVLSKTPPSTKRSTRALSSVQVGLDAPPSTMQWRTACGGKAPGNAVEAKSASTSPEKITSPSFSGKSVCSPFHFGST